MAENLMSSDHKAVSDSYREGWEATFGDKEGEAEDGDGDMREV